MPAGPRLGARGINDWCGELPPPPSEQRAPSVSPREDLENVAVYTVCDEAPSRTQAAVTDSFGQALSEQLAELQERLMIRFRDALRDMSAESQRLRENGKCIASTLGMNEPHLAEFAQQTPVRFQEFHAADWQTPKLSSERTTSSTSLMETCKVQEASPDCRKADPTTSFPRMSWEQLAHVDKDGSVSWAGRMSAELHDKVARRSAGLVCTKANGVSKEHAPKRKTIARSATADGHLVHFGGRDIMGMAEIDTPLDRWARLTDGLQNRGHEDAEEEVQIYKLQKCWSKASRGPVVPDSLVNGDVSYETVGGTSEASGQNHAVKPDCFDYFVLHPHGLKRFSWGVFGAFLVLHDVLVIPVVLSFSLNVNPLLHMFGILYWIVDLVVACFTGYQSNGLIELRFRRTTWNYLTSWFCPEFLTVVLDIAFLWLDHRYSDASVGDESAMALKVTKSLKAARLLRLLRLIRLIRIRKLSGILGQIAHDMQSQYYSILVRLGQQLACIMILNHYVACAWHAVASLSDRHDTWVTHFNLQEANFVYRYAASMHWALTQFTPATNNISPVNDFERMFACTTVLFAMVAFSTFVSGVTNSVNQLRNANVDRMRERVRLEAFIADRKLSYALGNQIMHFFTKNYHVVRRANESDIKFLTEMPDSILMQIHDQIYMPFLRKWPPFYDFGSVDVGLFQDVCHRAMIERAQLPQQDVFLPQTEDNCMYHLVSGAFKVLGSDGDLTDVNAGTWLSEMTMWVHWEHVNHIIGENTCNMVILDVTLFHKLLAQTGGLVHKGMRTLAFFIVGYAEDKANSDEISDLPLDTDLLQDLSWRAYQLTQPVRRKRTGVVSRHAFHMDQAVNTIGGSIGAALTSGKTLSGFRRC